MSGDVLISNKHGELRIPGNEILAFVAEWVRMQRISAMEDASDDELLGIGKVGR